MTDQNSQFFAILTAVGEAKQANADALGVPWTFSQMGVGDANGTEPIPSRTQTRLINERRRAPLNQVKVDPANANIVIAEQIIPPDVGGWWIREIGLYDADNDLVAVANCAPSFKPLLSQGTGKTQVVRMNFIVTSAANVTLKIDPAVVLATREFVELRLSEEIGKLDGKNSVRVATLGPIDLGGIPTLDGVALQAGDRVLVKDQVQGRENGLYVVGPGLWARAQDADGNAEVTPGLTVTVEQGAKLADTQWKLVTDAPIVVGTTPLQFQNVAAGYSGIAPRNVGGPITTAEAGKLIYFYGGATGQVLTLPSAADFPTGGKLNLQSMSGVPCELAAFGTERIWVGASTVASLTMYPCTELELVRVSSTEWFAQGTGTLYRLNSMPLVGTGANDGRLASTAFVQQELVVERGSAAPLMDGVAAAGTAVKKAREDHRHPTDTSRAPLASPVFTGVPRVPTAAASATGDQAASLDYCRLVVAALVDSAPGALDTLKELAAALGNDPNFAATMTYYLSLKAPLASPALTGTPTTPLAALFDDSSLLASTAFVRRFGNQFGGVGVYTASAQLPATDAGKLIYFAGSAQNQTLTLPPASSLPVGSKLHFQNMAPNQVFVSRAGTDTVQVGGVLTPVVVIPTGGDAYFTRVGTSDWFVNGTAVLDKLASFASLKQPNGWEKSPSGIIRQWGYANNGDMVNGTLITLPMTYPNEHFQTVVCAYNSTGDIDNCYIGELGTNFFRLLTQSQAAAGGPWVNNVVAARYVSYGW
ncbi:phage tail protein [Pseudomonas sp. SORT22]|uniref:phage tail protein n=1 Tax=Pseudomonas sp. SORT22 TaxID=2813842 RepID=UPI00201B7627|nr:phage tail protein [Pseudomonas sp. SORT22]